MRVTFREALPACSQVQRGGSGGLNQTICPSQPNTFPFLWRELNPGMQIYNWCQRRSVCVFGNRGEEPVCAAIVFSCDCRYSMYCWVCSDLCLNYSFFSQTFSYFRCDGMNWPLQVSADCLVLHVHLQCACIHSICGSSHTLKTEK